MEAIESLGRRSIVRWRHHYKVDYAGRLNVKYQMSD